ncbi:MAG TPA: peptidylprolyl isomerase [Methylomirabilota bacterium]|nr:peptidylprolyl isomerase [Methylomirabilota bacterium]
MPRVLWLIVAWLALPLTVWAQPTKSPTAVITLERGGQITLELWPADAPNHVKNFLDLAAKRFYDGQRVHRVEPGFVVQFGDPQSKTLPLNDPRMGSGGPGYTIKAEFNKRPFDRGVLGMARTDDPDSAGSQVYLMLAPAPFLNGKYTAFGRVVTGMEIVDTIKVGERIKSIAVGDR